ncbi:uncharacterized protein LOC108704219 [Xenopus laevis]|uniref:Uncharacterized protein LOC108704219 n=1 Tax=Xenopus laevis TaxID=8355 RepID=A0A8J0U423_XENLA|nr:uncharacterized protein LOC108704219 [Xenopus laevis]OCT58273.1 hypothetical protein XELAEV_18002212mg [Xenopus laevis]
MEQPAPDDLRERLRRYNIPNPIENVRHQFNHIFIMLFGMMGHGKSSLINSCISVLNNHNFQNVTGAGNKDSTETTGREIHNLTRTLSIVDNRGFNIINDDELSEARAQLRALRDMGEVKWDNDYKDTLQVFRIQMTADQTTFLVPVLVFSAETPQNSGDMNGLSTFVSDAFRITGIHPILVITHSSSENQSRVNKKFRDLGINHRISLENYTTNNTLHNPDTDKKILQFLDTCMSEAERGIKTTAARQGHFINQGTEQLQHEFNTLLSKKEKEIENLKKELQEKNKCSIL